MKPRSVSPRLTILLLTNLFALIIAAVIFISSLLTRSKFPIMEAFTVLPIVIILVWQLRANLPTKPTHPQPTKLGYILSIVICLILLALGIFNLSSTTNNPSPSLQLLTLESTTNQPITIYQSPSLDSQIISVADRFLNVIPISSQNTWANIQLEDGTQGWLDINSVTVTVQP